MADDTTGHNHAPLLERIARHAEEHRHLSGFNRARSGPVLSIDGLENLRAHLTNTLNDPKTETVIAKKDGSKMLFYNEKTNTFISLDPEQPHGGTTFRPKTPAQGRHYFENQAKRIEGLLGPDFQKIENGGLKAAIESFHAKTGEMPKMTGYLHDIGKKGGLLTGIIFGAGAAGTALIAGGSPAEAAELAYETAVPYGEAQIELKNGHYQKAAEAAAVEAASDAGMLAGGIAGAELGAVVGSAVPVVGTAIGAAAGAIIGGLSGGIAAGSAMDHFLDQNKPPTRDEVYRALPESLESAGPMVPPEVESLMVYKEPMRRLERELESLGILPAERAAKANELSVMSGLFDRQYEELSDYDGLPAVYEYLAANPKTDPHAPMAAPKEEFAPASLPSPMGPKL